MKKNTTELWLIWKSNDDDENPEDGYFEMHESIEDAVQNGTEGFDDSVEVFKASLKSIGFYKDVRGVKKVAKRKAGK